MKKIHWQKYFKKNTLLIVVILIASYNIVQSAYHLFYGDLLFHTDIARDFLLTQEMIDEKKLTLIGPRAGGIPGVFYSPLWFYINAPMLILGDGNPVIVGYFWMVLAVLSLGTTYYITRRIFGNTAACVAALIYSFEIVGFVRGMTPWFGSVALSPPLMYLMYQFVIKKRLRDYSLAVLINGFIICFQPAFGLITLFITYLIGLYYTVRFKKAIYLIAFPVSSLPLFTYFLFEIRHNFLQTRAIIEFLFHNSSQFQLWMILFIARNRIDQFLGRINIIGDSSIFSNLVFLGIYLSVLIIVFKKTSLKKAHRTFILLFYLYFGMFWATTFLFKGIVWDYYHLGFMPLLIIIFSSMTLFIKKKVFILMTIWVLATLLFRTWDSGPQWISTFTGQNGSSWKLNEDVAKFVNKNVSDEFGYFVYSPDELGYSIKYAMNYIDKKNKNTAAICAKETNTFLLYDPYKKSPNEFVYWREKRVRINKPPVLSRQLGQILIEKYVLNPQEIAISPDPNLVCGLHFR